MEIQAHNLTPSQSIRSLFSGIFTERSGLNPTLLTTSTLGRLGLTRGRNGQLLNFPLLFLSFSKIFSIDCINSLTLNAPNFTCFRPKNNRDFSYLTDAVFLVIDARFTGQFLTSFLKILAKFWRKRPFVSGLKLDPKT